MRSLILRTAILVSALALSFSSQAQQSAPVAPEHPATVAQIERLMTLTHATDAVNKAIADQIALQKKEGPQIFPDAFWSDCQAEFAKIDWVKIATPVYQRYFSETDADAVIAFYSTPVGQKVLESSHVFTQEMTAQGYTLGSEIGRRVAEKYKDEIAANMKKLQEHNSAPAPQ